MNNTDVSQSPVIPATYPSGDSKVGFLIGPYDVEVAVLAVLMGWFEPYLSDAEAQRGIPNGRIPRPPGPESYRGSFDTTAFQQDETPTVIVAVEPSGDLERTASAGYAQGYTVAVGVVVTGESEDEVRQRASYYGSAAMGALGQQGSLGGAIPNLVETRLTLSPTVDFPNPDNRQLACVNVNFNVIIQPVFDDQYAGTFLAEPVEPPWGSWPIITSETVTVTGPSAFASTAANSATLTGVSPWPHPINGTSISGTGITGGTIVLGSNQSQQTITLSEPVAKTNANIAIFLGPT